MQKLICLRLQGQPADDVIEGTLLAWCEALDGLYVESEDAPRLRAGFRELMRSCDHWPSPADLRAAMPSPPQPVPERKPYLKLVDDDSQRRGMQQCNAILKRLGGAIVPPNEAESA